MSAPGNDSALNDHPVVSDEAWLAARKELLAREKQLTRLRDQIAQERRALPWRRVQTAYVFDTAEGPKTLGDLFRGRSQLLVQHFMFGPGWSQGCPSCSYMADHIGGMLIHLAHRDVSFVAVSRAPLTDLQKYRQRMGWQFDWVSSQGSDFNFDFGVSIDPDQQGADASYNYGSDIFEGEEMPGISVFTKNAAGEVFHTYSTYGRGVEAMMGTYVLLDLTPKGRDEEPDRGMAWARRHDSYPDTARR